MIAAVATAGALPPVAALAATSTEQVTETDPYAKSMGFRVDTANVDQVKFPRHDTTQHCSGCQLFSGKEGEPLGPC
jgi:hypothetical protein